jgi:hypothetical protein
VSGRWASAPSSVCGQGGVWDWDGELEAGEDRVLGGRLVGDGGRGAVDVDGALEEAEKVQDGGDLDVALRRRRKRVSEAHARGEEEAEGERQDATAMFMTTWTVSRGPRVALSSMRRAATGETYGGEADQNWRRHGAGEIRAMSGSRECR